MKIFIKFLWVVFGKPIWFIVTIAFVIVEKLQTITSFIEKLFRLNFTQFNEYFFNTGYYKFLNTYWVPILIIFYLVVLVLELYKIALPRIGDTIKADLEFELFPRQKEGYASIKVNNKEKDDLFDVELSYKELYIIENGNLISKLDNINGGGANISWWLGGQKEKIIRGKKKGVFNLVKIENNHFCFLFDDGSQSQVKNGVYKVLLTVDGNMGKDGRKIETITKTCYIEIFAKNSMYYIDIRDFKEPTSEIEPYKQEPLILFGA